VFRIAGSASTRGCLHPSNARELVVDRRSAKWMLQYLAASLDDSPYPPRSNMYGTPWKVALSVYCIARGSASNRRVLGDEGAFEQLFKTLQRAALRAEPHAEEQAVRALRAMLLSPDEVPRGLKSAREFGHWSNPAAESSLVEAGRDAPPHSSGDVDAFAALAAIAAGRGVCTTDSSRRAAAEVLLAWGEAWHVERLLLLAARRDCGSKGDRCVASQLQPSMIRAILRFYVLLGGRRVSELPASSSEGKVGRREVAEAKARRTRETNDAVR